MFEPPIPTGREGGKSVPGKTPAVRLRLMTFFKGRSEAANDAPVIFLLLKKKKLSIGWALFYKNHSNNNCYSAPAPMNPLPLAKIAYHCAILFACVTLSCRQQPTVLMSPNEDELVVLNGCVVSACNYLAAVKTQHVLDKNFWVKILLVRYNNHPAGHAYCVWETDGTIYGYDRNAGAFPIPVYTQDPRAIAIVLAQELGKVLNENLSVDRAEFVESQQAQLARF